MDKETLSHYGWIVILVLILSVLLALATPFGNFIAGAIKSTTAGLFGVNQGALGAAGITIPGQSMDDTNTEGDNKTPAIEGCATFTDGTTLTWEELKSTENGAKYGYDATLITDEKIGESVFAYNSYLVSLEIKDSVTSIGKNAFSYCKTLTKVVIPEGITTIPDYAFWGCWGLTDINIPSTVTSIGFYGISYCLDMKEITIPSSVTSLGEGVFVGMSSLEKITVDSNNTNYCSENGILFNKDKTVLIHYPRCHENTTYSIPNTVTSMLSMYDGHFSNCKNLTNATISNGMSAIVDRTFYGCSSLETVNIPSSINSIGTSAFKGCTALKTINFDGTKAQWNTISINQYWNIDCDEFTIVCTDGTITIPTYES